jgi:hypothetical protein
MLDLQQMKPRFAFWLALVVFTTTAWAESSQEIIASVVKRPRVTPSPDVPVLSHGVGHKAVAEMDADPEVKEAMCRLSQQRNYLDWDSGLKTLAKKKAAWCLQAALCHPALHVQTGALRALRDVGNKDAVVFLLVYADKLCISRMGSPTGQVLVIEEVSATLSSLTGLKIKPLQLGFPPGELRRDMIRCAAWLVENGNTQPAVDARLAFGRGTLP